MLFCNKASTTKASSGAVDFSFYFWALIVSNRASNFPETFITRKLSVSRPV